MSLKKPWMRSPAVVLSLLLTACGGSSRNGAADPASASGNRPVRYVICAATGGQCRVVARFATFESCEQHKRVSGMLCDSRSVPGEMQCRTDPGPHIAAAYCTK